MISAILVRESVIHCGWIADLFFAHARKFHILSKMLLFFLFEESHRFFPCNCVVKDYNESRMLFYIHFVRMFKYQESQLFSSFGEVSTKLSTI